MGTNEKQKFDYLSLRDLDLNTNDVFVIDDLAVLEEEYDIFLSQPYICIDTEWRSFVDHQTTAIVQLVTFDPFYMYIIDLHVLGEPGDIIISELLGNKSIIKVGFAFHNDVRSLRNRCLNTMLYKNINNIFDIQIYANRFLRHELPRDCSLTKLVQWFLGKDLKKSKRFGNWERRPLSKDLIEYAIMDSIVLNMAIKNIHTVINCGYLDPDTWSLGDYNEELQWLNYRYRNHCNK